ncbi:hypothetical protein ALC62_13615, partial [Cyphomyrmex costatus]
QESVKWLETNQEPWELVETHWKATTSIRLNDITKNSNTVSDIFTKWPILKHPLGWLLIDQDFKCLNLDAIENAINQWPTFFKDVQKVCSLEKKKILRVEEYIIFIIFLKADSKAIAQLCALSYMIPPKGRVRTKKGHWKPSMIEYEESFVVHVKAGPLVQMSSIRFEAKHKELKQTAKAVSSRRNPAYTLALKHQLQLNYRLFILNKGFEKRVEWGTILYESLTDIDLYIDFKSILPSVSFDNYKCISWIKVNGTFYKPDMVLNVNNSDCKFAKLKYIFKSDLNEILFIYKQLKVVQLNTHFYAHEIIELQSWGFIFQSKLTLYKPCNIHLSVDCKNYIPVVP